MSLVLDASMALRFVLDDEFDDAAERILTAVATDGAIVPSLWEYEVFNGLRSAERRGRLTEAGVTHALRGLAGLPIDHITRRPEGSQLIAIARRYEISVYDASYLWLAMEANLPLASGDASLRNAALTAGVALASP